MAETRSSHQYRRGYDASRRRLRRLARDREVIALARRIAAARRVALADILRVTRGNRAVVEARQLAIYMAHVQLGRPQDVVAWLFSRDRTTVAYACHLMEDRRDDAGFEADIGHIIADAPPQRTPRRRKLRRRRVRHVL
jgi:chromosomal replication initiation ATPase DnaA